MSLSREPISAAGVPRRDQAAADLSSVESTALTVAHRRSLEHARPDRLFADLFARAFVAAAGPVGEAAARLPSAPADYFAVRTRFFDDALVQACREGCRQVVLLAAGLDARAFRLKWPDGVRIFEVEMDAILRFKEDVLGAMQVAPARERVLVAADLREDWTSRLVAAGFSPELPTAWLAEGLLFYLSPGDGDQLLRQVTDLSVRGSRLAIEHVNGAIRQSMQAAMAALAAHGAPWKSSLDDPAAWLADAGWDATVADHREIGERYGRPLPGPASPPAGPDPKAWLALARRT